MLFDGAGYTEEVGIRVRAPGLHPTVHLQGSLLFLQLKGCGVRISLHLVRVLGIFTGLKSLSGCHKVCPGFILSSGSITWKPTLVASRWKPTLVASRCCFQVIIKVA